MTASTLTLDDFARLFATTVDDLPAECLSIVASKDFRYRRLDMAARDSIVTAILQRIDSETLWVSGPGKQAIWEKGWSENVQEYDRTHSVEALTPKFIDSRPTLRLDRDYMQPVEAHFEFNFIDVYRHWAFKKYLQDAQTIFEFGCGSCQHLPVLAKLFPSTAWHGLDWAVASSTLIAKLAAETSWNITGHVFDLYNPDESLALDTHDGVYTVGTMEQLGNGFEPFLQFLLRKRPRIVMHMEAIAELYDPAFLPDYLALRYHRKRNYLDGYLSRLRQLESAGVLTILKAHRLLFGSMYHDPYSLVVWKPR
ncbi:MAG: hypothetical protein AB7N91_13390 [Candidatus Tectimicrobiota bacterium]